MKKLVVLCVSVALASVTSISFGAPGASKIGVVDVAKVLKSNSDLDTMNKNLESKFSDRKAAILTLRKKAQAEIDYFQKNNKTMTFNQIKNEENSIQTMKDELDMKTRSFQEDFNKERSNELQVISKKVNTAVAKVAKVDHFDLVLSKVVVLFSESSLDVTDRVIKEYK